MARETSPNESDAKAIARDLVSAAVEHSVQRVAQANLLASMMGAALDEEAEARVMFTPGAVMLALGSALEPAVDVAYAELGKDGDTLEAAVVVGGDGMSPDTEGYQSMLVSMTSVKASDENEEVDAPAEIGLSALVISSGKIIRLSYSVVPGMPGGVSAELLADRATGPDAFNALVYAYQHGEVDVDLLAAERRLTPEEDALARDAIAELSARGDWNKALTGAFAAHASERLAFCN